MLAVLAMGQDCQEAQTLARQAYEQRHYDQASVHFGRAVAACGPSAALFLALGQAQLLARRPADALPTLERIPVDDPDYVPALKVKAKALYLLRRDPEAEETLKRAAARAPGDAEIPYDLGRIYYQLGRHTEAAAALGQATALDPRAYKAWDNLGLASEALGDVAQAQQHYLKAIALVHKDHPQLRRRLRELRGPVDQAREVSAGVRPGSRSGPAQSGRAPQSFSRGEGARRARAGRSERALVRAGRRVEPRLPRAALPARADLPHARAGRRRRPGAEVIPGGCGPRTERTPVKARRVRSAGLQSL